MNEQDVKTALATIGALVNLAAPGSGTVLTTIGGLVELATAANATYEDGKRALDLINGHVDGTVTLEQLEGEIEAMEARGLKPVDPEQD